MSLIDVVTPNQTLVRSLKGQMLGPSEYTRGLLFLISVLEDPYEQKTGVRVRHVGAGTSAALKLGESGTFELVFQHAKATSRWVLFALRHRNKRAVLAKNTTHVAITKKDRA